MYSLDHGHRGLGIQQLEFDNQSLSLSINPTLLSSMTLNQLLRQFLWRVTLTKCMAIRPATLSNAQFLKQYTTKHHIRPYFIIDWNSV